MEEEEPWPPIDPLPTSDEMRYMNLMKDTYLEHYKFPICEDATKFEKLSKVGQGTFG